MQLNAAILASDIATAGSFTVKVTNPAPGGGIASIAFTVNTPPVMPTITSLSPPSAVAGGPQFTLTVNGTNFVAGAVVAWNSNSRATTFVSSTQLSATILASDIATAGFASVFVDNNNGKGSNNQQRLFEIDNRQPAISSLAPSSVQAGAAPLTLTVNGSGFVTGAGVQWNGSSRLTSVASGTQLTAAILASDVANQGSAQITVVNPAPSLGPSAAATFTIAPLTSNPVPAITMLHDTSAWANWPGFPLSLEGSGFVAATTGQWNGLTRKTTVLSGALLKTGITLNDLAQPGTAQVNTFNPLPGGGISNLLSFTINTVPTGSFGVIERSSLATDLTESDGPSYSPAISADGRFVVFVSDADNLIPQNGFRQVYLRDTCLGPTAPTGCVPSVTRVSVPPVGTQAANAAISANGRYVAFTSFVTNLGFSGPPDLYVRDTCFGVSGCTPSTTLVASNIGSVYGPSQSAGGRYIAFNVSRFVDCGYGNCSVSAQTYVSDTCVGVASTCTTGSSVVSVANDGSPPNDTSLNLTSAISADGRFVAFTSTGTNLVSGGTAHGAKNVFLRDTCAGTAAASCTPSTQLVSLANNGSQLNEVENELSISGSGRFVTFTTSSNNVLPGDRNTNVFVRDTCFGAPAGCTPSTTQGSLANDGSQPTSSSFSGRISADGRFVVFISDSTNLVAGDTSPFPKVFLRDTCFGVAGCRPSTTRLSVALDGTAANNQSAAPMLSGDSHYVVFSSLADNLAPGDTNQVQDVFVARTNVQ